MRKEADRLGIVYTPVEVVDFILHSADEILQDEFGRSLNDEGVHVLDPFTGTGTFLARLLQSDLIQPDDLERKYRQELHANELVLLAYYIAAVNIEEVFRGRHGEDSGYEPFNGIVLTDTFNLNKAEDPTLSPENGYRKTTNAPSVNRSSQSKSSSATPHGQQDNGAQTTTRTWNILNLKSASAETYAEHSKLRTNKRSLRHV